MLQTVTQKTNTTSSSSMTTTTTTTTISSSSNNNGSNNNNSKNITSNTTTTITTTNTNSTTVTAPTTRSHSIITIIVTPSPSSHPLSGNKSSQTALTSLMPTDDEGEFRESEETIPAGQRQNSDHGTRRGRENDGGNEWKRSDTEKERRGVDNMND
jgi:hypothetical protein